MGITIKKHRRNLSYDDAATLSELWEITAQFDRSFYRELKDQIGRASCRERVSINV